MPRSEQLFIFRLTPLVLQLLELDPAEGRALLERCGLPASAAVGTCTAPVSSVRQLLAEAAARFTRDSLPLALAEAAPEGTYGVAELLVRTAPTLSAGLRSLAKYAAMINPIGRFDYRQSAGRAEMHYFVPGSRDVLGEHLNEFTIAYLVRALRRVTAEDLAPTEVWFAHARSTSAAALTERLAGRVRFRAATCGIAFRSALADRPLRTSDTVVYDYLLAQADERAAALGERSYAAVIIDLIENQLGFVDLDLQRAARRLGTTARTVQRRLEGEGTSFREVVDQARKRQAEGLIASGTPLAHVAQTLGFSDARSFRRAFQRWAHERTPGGRDPSHG